MLNNQILTSTTQDITYHGISLVKGEGDDTRPNILNGTIMLADFSTVTNFDFYGNGSKKSALIVDNKKGVTINDVHVYDYTNGAGLEVKGDSDVTLDHFTSEHNRTGIDQVGGNIKVTNGVTLHDNIENGLSMNGGTFSADSIIAEGNLNGIVLLNNSNLNVTQDISVANNTERGLSATDSIITANNLNADSTGSSGVFLNNSQLNLGGDLSAQHNGVHGIDAASSAITAHNITASHHTNGSGIMLNLDSNIAATGDLVLNDNTGDGLHAKGAGKGNIKAQNLIANQNSGSGVVLENINLELLQDLNVTDNRSHGLTVETGNIKAVNVFADNSSKTGLLLNHANLIIAQKISANNTGANGIQATESAIKALNIAANSNAAGYGMFITGGSFDITDQISASHNGSDGLFATKAGIGAQALLTSDNGGNGTNLDDVTLTISNVIETRDNQYNGLLATNTKAITADRIVADSNGGDGVNVTGGSLTTKHEVNVAHSGANGFVVNNVTVQVENLFADNSAQNGAVINGGSLAVAQQLTVINTGLNGLVATDAKIAADSIVARDHVNGSGIIATGGAINTTQGIDASHNSQYGLQATGATVTAGALMADANGMTNVDLHKSQLNLSGALSANAGNSDGIVADNSSITADSITAHENSNGSGIVATNSNGNSISTHNIDVSKNSKDGLNTDGFNVTADNIMADHNGAAGVVFNNGKLAVANAINVADTAAGFSATHAIVTATSLTADNTGATGVTLNDTNLELSGALSSDSKNGDGIVANDSDITAASISATGHENGSGIIAKATVAADGSIVKKPTINVLDGTLDVSHNGQDGLRVNDVDVTAAALTADAIGGTSVALQNSLLNVSGAVSVIGGNGDGIVASNSSIIADSIVAQDHEQGTALNMVDGTLTVDGTIDVSGSDNGLNTTRVDIEAGNLNATNNKAIGVTLNDSNLVLSAMLSANSNGDNGINAHDSTITVGGISADNNARDGIFAMNTAITADTLSASGNHDNAEGSLIRANGVNLFGGKLSITNSITLDKNTGFGLQTHGAISDEATEINIANGSASQNGLGGIELENANFTADHLKLNDNNGVGISLAQGSLTLTDSEVLNNKGMGILISGYLDQARTIYLENLNVSRTRGADNGLNGEGIDVRSYSEVTLNDITLDSNWGTGLWFRSGLLNGSNIDVSNNGHTVTDPQSLNDLMYGIRIDDSKNPDYATKVDTLDHVTITGNVYHGLLITGGTSTITDLISRDNLDGVMITNGTVTIDTADIDSNRRFGVRLRKFDYNASDADDQALGARNVTLTHVNVHDTQNHDTKANGGLGEGYGIAIEHNSLLNLMDSDIHNNQGFGIYMKAGILNMSGSNETYSSFVRDNAPGGILIQQLYYTNKPVINLSYTTISGNGFTPIQQYVHDKSTTTLDRASMGWGLANIEGYDLDATLTNVKITGNNRGVYLQLTSGSNISFTNTSITNNIVQANALTSFNEVAGVTEVNGFLTYGFNDGVPSMSFENSTKLQALNRNAGQDYPDSKIPEPKEETLDNLD